MSIPEKHNIYENGLPEEKSRETFEELIRTQELLIEKIVSNGESTSEGVWYDQDKDEWVVLLTGNAQLKFENGTLLNMAPGDYILIPAHCRHRVEQTSVVPNCTWIAVHGKLCTEDG